MNKFVKKKIINLKMSNIYVGMIQYNVRMISQIILKI